MSKWLPTADYLRECFVYDAETGTLTWKARPPHHFKDDRSQRSWNTRYQGTVAGRPNKWGHIGIVVNFVRFQAHRLIWVMQTDTLPPKEIDHKNGNPADNRWSNLREANHRQNLWNQKPRDGRDLPRGVVRSGNRFCANRRIANGRMKHIGVYATPEEAHAAWCAVARKERGEFFRNE